MQNCYSRECSFDKPKDVIYNGISRRKIIELIGVDPLLMEDDARALLISRQQDEFYCLLNKPNNQLQFWVMNSTAAAVA